MWDSPWIRVSKLSRFYLKIVAIGTEKCQRELTLIPPSVLNSLLK